MGIRARLYNAQGDDLDVELAARAVQGLTDEQLLWADVEDPRPADLDALCEAASVQGKHTMWGAVSAENTDGIAFHAACGFTEHGRLPQVGYKFGRWLDLVLMGRRL